MSIERPIGPGAEPPPLPPSAGTQSAGDQPATAVRLQILSTEHWSLLARGRWRTSRSPSRHVPHHPDWRDRRLALVAQADEFGEGFRLFALVILPVVLIIGIGTNLRMGMSNYHDALCVTGMNRIRAGYLEIARSRAVLRHGNDGRPARHPPHDGDATAHIIGGRDAGIDAGTREHAELDPHRSHPCVAQHPAGRDIGPTIVIAVAGFITSLAAWSWYGAREIGKVLDDRTRPIYPTRDDG